MSQFWASSPGATPPTTPPLFEPGPLRESPPGRPPRPLTPTSPASAGAAPSPRFERGPSRGGPSPDARNALIIAFAVAAAVLLFAASFTWVVSRASDDSAAPTNVPSTLSPATPPSAPPSTAPATPPTTAAPLPPAETLVIPELQQFVAGARGLTFTADVPIALLSDEEFSARLLAAYPPAALESMLWELQVLGLIGTGPDAIEELEQLLTDSLVGLYSEGQVLVKGDERSPEIDTTIVHELTHALDDQTFGFVRPELAEAQDESPFGLDAVVEGSAMSVEAAYAASIGLEYRSPAEGGLSDGLLVMPKYLFGEAYVRALLDDGGNARLDDAFRSPPATSKEVMESAYFLTGYEPIPVEPPPAPEEVIDEGLFGQVRFWQMFTQVLPPEQAEELASTWAGDWHVVWVDGLEQCLRVDVALETPEAASVFAEQLRAWAVTQDDAVVEELSSGLVRLTTCAPRPPPPPGSGSPA